MMLMSVVVCFLLCPVIVSNRLHSDDDDYIDPFDMMGDAKPKATSQESPPQDTTKDKEKVTAEPVKEVPVVTTPVPMATEEPSTNQKPRESEGAGHILTKKYVDTILKHLEGRYPSGTSQEYSMFIKLTKSDVNMLRRFVYNNKGSLHDINEILSSMILSITESHLGTFGKVSLWFEDRFGTSIDAALKMIVVLFGASVFTTLEMRLNISWRQRFMKLIVLAFIISIPMTWYELYKASEIQQQTMAMKDAPPECARGNVEEKWMETTFAALKSWFTFEKDNCQKYYEQILIHPILRVPPTKAVAVTFVRFFVSPLKDVGGALSEFIRALLVDLPLTLYPIAIALVSIFFFLLLFMWFGYSIRLPFFLSIEPTPGYAAIGGSDTLQVNKAIEENTQKMIDEIKAIQEDMQARNDNMVQKIQDMERLQKFALEHTVTMATGDVNPPTLPSAILPALKSKSSPTVVQEGYVENLLDNSLESSGSGDFTEMKSPIPCSDFSQAEGEETKVVVTSTNSEHRSRQSPARSRLPVSQPRGKSKESDGVTSPVSQDSGERSGIQRSISQPETLQPSSTSQAQRGGTFYKM